MQERTGGAGVEGGEIKKGRDGNGFSSQRVEEQKASVTRRRCCLFSCLPSLPFFTHHTLQRLRLSALMHVK